MPDSVSFQYSWSDGRSVRYTGKPIKIDESYNVDLTAKVSAEMIDVEVIVERVYSKRI